MLVPKVLELALHKALFDGIKATFLLEGKDGDEICIKFANATAPQMAQAIDAYIRSMTITGGLVNTTGTPVAQAGPITVPPTIT